MVLPALGAGAVVEKALQAVSNDIIVLGGQMFRKVTVKEGRTKREILVPVDVQLHVNPISIGVGLLGAAVALFFGAGRLHLPVLGGTIELYKGPFADEFDAWKGKREVLRDCKAGGGFWVDVPGEGAFNGHCEVPSNKSCDELEVAYKAAIKRKDYRAAASFGNRAKEMGCEWAKSRP